MTCPLCNGRGEVMAKNGGIGLRDGKWHTYSDWVTCQCQVTLRLHANSADVTNTSPNATPSGCTRQNATG